VVQTTKVKKGVEGTTKVLWAREVRFYQVHSPKFAQVRPLPKKETVETNLHASRGNQHPNPNQTCFPSIRNESTSHLRGTASLTDWLVVADLNVGSALEGNSPLPAHLECPLMDSQVNEGEGYFQLNSHSWSLGVSTCQVDRIQVKGKGICSCFRAGWSGGGEESCVMRRGEGDFWRP
jgi:hypothetical protein